MGRLGNNDLSDVGRGEGLPVDYSGRYVGRNGPSRKRCGHRCWSTGLAPLGHRLPSKEPPPEDVLVQ
ncbi:hypothetical protein MUK42_06293 [Musa troglodytarum]|uniref:Uncharacterized protein n=1 Tax=Musa troglodytarum TaxID=320322 RepID=A0A9E7GN14_9LILI|nr:hypothetical protein MUK42_06293 [Musa troglodytarum]